jgi:hypothetical protein
LQYDCVEDTLLHLAIARAVRHFEDGMHLKIRPLGVKAFLIVEHDEPPMRPGIDELERTLAVT